MTTMKTLMLASAAVLSLGAGVASAQNLSPSDAEATYFQGQAKVAAAPRVTGGVAGQETTTQYGSSEGLSAVQAQENELSTGIGGGF